MIGDLLRSSTSIRYFLNRSQSGAEVNAFGATHVQNAAVAENNSPEPRDRVSFRYNYFRNTQGVTGLSDAPPFSLVDIYGPGVAGQGIQTSSYDSNLYNFSFEKTFLDRLFSLEMRFPLVTGLSPRLNLREKDNPGAPSQGNVPVDLRNPAGNRLIGFLDANGNQVTAQFTPGLVYIPGTTQGLPANVNPRALGLNALQAFSVRQGSTPVTTRGSEGNQFGDMSAILKASLYETPGLLVSGGLAVGIPTGPDTNVRVTDYVGGRTSLYAEIQRIREFNIANETWALSPFLAALATPTDRFFAQGFLQFECPLNGSSYSFSDTFPIVAGRSPAQLGFVPVAQHGRIDEQFLMHLDVGTGFWVVRRPEARWLNGVAPTVELHYITTLNNADIITLPSDNTYARVGGTTQRTTSGPEIGNLNNRVDILDLTLGMTFLVANRATLATAVVLPLKGSADRTYDWEFQLQLNIFFGGGPGRRGF
jgi:hypothetical protein